jgi:hypothetical protein
VNISAHGPTSLRIVSARRHPPRGEPEVTTMDIKQTIAARIAATLAAAGVSVAMGASSIDGASTALLATSLLALGGAILLAVGREKTTRAEERRQEVATRSTVA